MSSRTMSLSAWRPTDVTGRSSRNRDPALGPRLTTSSPEPLGSPSTLQSLLLTSCSLSDDRGDRRNVENARRRRRVLDISLPYKEEPQEHPFRWSDQSRWANHET